MKKKGAAIVTQLPTIHWFIGPSGRAEPWDPGTSLKPYYRNPLTHISGDDIFNLSFGRARQILAQWKGKGIARIDLIPPYYPPQNRNWGPPPLSHLAHRDTKETPSLFGLSWLH